MYYGVEYTDLPVLPFEMETQRGLSHGGDGERQYWWFYDFGIFGMIAKARATYLSWQICLQEQ